MLFIKNITNTLKKMHSFVFIAICYNALYGQKHFNHNGWNFQDGLKTEFQAQSHYITDLQSDYFLHNAK